MKIAKGTSRPARQLKRVGFFTIATNNYVHMLTDQLEAISSHIVAHNWHYVVATDRVVELSQFAEAMSLEGHLTIVECPAYRFPLASMLRFKYIASRMQEFDFICYIDCDMAVEDSSLLQTAITNAREVCLVRHPGWSRDFGLEVSAKEKLVEQFIKISFGGLGGWETRRKSNAYLPRKLRATYFAGGIFFGPKAQVLEMATQCDVWMDKDLKSGIVARVHDESYLNRWAALNTHASLGPEFCFTEYPWLPDLKVVVRALDKSAMNTDGSSPSD